MHGDISPRPPGAVRCATMPDLFGAAPAAAPSAVAYAAALTGDPVNRERHDFYPTHPAATRALLAHEAFSGPVWEPACGAGDMSRVLEGSGYDVVSTDLIDRGYGESGRDFLMEQSLACPNIVTNPPFRHAQKFAEHALNLGALKVALFLRLAFLEGVQRSQWLKRSPLARVWVMSRRVPMQRGRLATHGDGHGVIAFAWFVWTRGHLGEPAIGWLDWKAA
jgi:hypothetical protein